MKKKIKHKLTFLTLLLTCIVSGFISLVFTYQYFNDNARVIKDAKIQAQMETDQSAKSIDMSFAKLIKVVNSLADNINSGKISRDSIFSTVMQKLVDNPQLAGLGVAYAPYIGNHEVVRSSPYYCNIDNFEAIDQKSLLQVYSTPIIYQNKKTTTPMPIGYAFMDYSLTNLKKLLSSFSMDKNGYGFILDQDGRFISHPINEYVTNHKTIFDIANDQDDKALSTLGTLVTSGKQGVMNYINKQTGQTAWIFYSAIPSIGWTLVNVYIKDDISLDTDILRHKLIWLSIWLVVFSISLIILLFKAYDKNDRHTLWITSFVTAFAVLGGLIFIWFLALNFPSEDRTNVTKVYDKSGMETFIDTLKLKDASNLGLTYLPIGIYIQTIEFGEANTIFLTGYLWQKYPHNIPTEQRDPGVIIQDAKSDSYSLAYSTVDYDYDLYGWYFRVEVKAIFDYSKYPFDRNNISIKMWSKDMLNNILLIPDLSTYKTINSSSKPGLDKHLIVSGWEILGSNFQYRNNAYDSNFGIKNNTHNNAPYDLYFNIKTKRQFLDPFISRIIPIVIILLLLFVVSILETSVDTYLATSGALLLTVIFSHISLRESIVASQVVYLEYFYLLLYLFILLYSANSILNNTVKGIKFISYKNNLIPKILYWPSILILLFSITAFVFY